jgi:hypothetical protein
MRERDIWRKGPFTFIKVVNKLHWVESRIQNRNLKYPYETIFWVDTSRLLVEDSEYNCYKSNWNIMKK